MFRRLLVLACAVAIVAGAVSWQAQAAPVTGSFSMLIDFWGACYYDNPDTPDVECTKIDKILVHFYADLELTLSVSGLELYSQSHFTFAGLSTQLFRTTATVGAMTFNNWLVFAPDICEVEAGFSYIFGCAGNFTDPLTFRKKVAEVTLNIAGLTLGLRALFANLGPFNAPNFRTGLVLILGGATVSGINVRSETWVGAIPGYECFSNDVFLGTYWPTCQVYLDNGIVFGPPLNFNLELLQITGMKLAGVTHNIAIAMNFSGSAFPFLVPAVGQYVYSNSLQPSAIQITSTGRIDPLRLTVSNRLRLTYGLTVVQDMFNFAITIGEVSATAYFYITPGTTGDYNVVTGSLSMQYDPPGVSVTEIVSFCETDEGPGQPFVGLYVGPNLWALWRYGPPNCKQFTDGVQHHIIFAQAEVGDLTVGVGAMSRGSLIGNFDRFAIDAIWQVGGVSFESFTYFRTDYLVDQVFIVSVKF